MILILTNSKDVSADFVEKWLHEYNTFFFRINADELFENTKLFIDICNNELTINEVVIKAKDVKIVWYRKFGSLDNTAYFKKLKKKIPSVDYKQLINESYEVLETISQLFDKSKWLTNYKNIRINKMTILKEAVNLGLKVPKTFVVNQKEQIVNLSKSIDLITKSIYEILFFNRNDISFSMFTKELKESDLELLPLFFNPSLVQEKIIKKFEVRAFYLLGTFYSMAIFSQFQESSKTDFRKTDIENPNNIVPIEIPTEIRIKLEQLLIKIGLNCCSIDLIVNEDDEFIFLEINPTGQFGMIGLPLNYELHKKIAKTLISFI
jgi:ATP-GRASP peptide maturase of grasp-with-spasm system